MNKIASNSCPSVASVFIRRKFLSDNLCELVRSYLNNQHWRKAPVGDSLRESRVNIRTRSSSICGIPREAKIPIYERLISIQPTLSAFFRITLNDFEQPAILKYEKGDFFRPHVDKSYRSGAADWARRRRISVVVFLNSPDEAADPYSGGELTLYGEEAANEERSTQEVFKGERGLLVAFKTDVVHEVKPVTFGRRFTVVSWYC